MFKIIHTSVIFKVTKGKDGTPEYTPVAIAPVTCPSDASVKRGVGKGDDIATKAQKTNACLFHEAQTCDSVPFGAVAIKESRPRKKTTVKDSDGVFNDENLARLVALRMQGVRALQAFMKVNRVCYNEGKAALTSPAWLGLDENMRSVREAAASRLEYQLPIKVGVEYADVDKQKWMLRDMGTMSKLDAWVVKPGRNQDTKNFVVSEVVPSTLRISCNNGEMINSVADVHKKGMFNIGIKYVVRKAVHGKGLTFQTKTSSPPDAPTASTEPIFDKTKMRFCKSSGLACVRVHVPLFDEACREMGVSPVTGQDVVSIMLRGRLLDATGTDTLYNPSAKKLPRDVKALRSGEKAWW